jgi:dTDP-glucose pyrophosphorylase
VVESIDAAGHGIALLLDARGRLEATITDGDVRRALLNGCDLESSIERLLETRAKTSPEHGLTAPATATEAELLDMMNTFGIRHIPLVDADGRVVGVSLLSEIVRATGLGVTAVVMAGGLGSRLHPLTAEVPKPMLPIGDRPLLVRILGQLRAAGILHVTLATGYLADVIAQHIGDGSQFGVAVQYVEEDEPLGTAGALGLVGATESPLLVVNGDIVTNVNFSAMLDYHLDNEAQMTVAVRILETSVPFGVIEAEGHVVTGVTEKPVLRHVVNAGLYLVNPELRRLIPKQTQFQMTDLIQAAIGTGAKVVAFPIREYWLDIGSHEDYGRAVEDARLGCVD